MERAWRQRDSLRDQRRLRWWLDRIVVREAIRLNRRPWWRTSEAPIEEHTRLLADPTATITPARLALAAAFRTLPVAQRAAVVLHLHLGYSVAETAGLTGASVETTRSRLRLARRRLRAELSEEAS
jgi:RNA polymerase sigma-70 factor (ECF subfamily)